MCLALDLVCQRFVLSWLRPNSVPTRDFQLLLNNIPKLERKENNSMNMCNTNLIVFFSGRIL